MELLQQPPKTQMNIVIQEINTQFIAETTYVKNKHENLERWHGLLISATCDVFIFQIPLFRS